MEANFVNERQKHEILEISEIIEEGGWIIRFFKDGTIKLFEIPQFGGEEREYSEIFYNVFDAIKIGRSWT